MWTNIILSALLTANTLVVNTALSTDIELFDAKQEKVVQHFASTPEIRNEVLSWLRSIDGISAQFSLNQGDGVIYRIPVAPPCHVQNKWFNATVSEVFLLRGKTRPMLLLFEGNQKQHLVTFTHDPATFYRLTGNSIDLTHVQNQQQKSTQEYAKWGRLAMKEARSRYPNAAIIDYLHVAGRRISESSHEEKFKMWLRQGHREWGVLVTIVYNPTNNSVTSIRLGETSR